MIQNQPLKNCSTLHIDAWHQQLEDGIHVFLEKVILDASKQSNFSRDRLVKLQRDWEMCKSTIDFYFADREEFDEDLE